MEEEKKYWIVCFPRTQTYISLYKTEFKAIKFVETMYSNEEYILVEWK